ncbi:MAG: efflux RND transporter permease subunit [Planctomycetota bacterium]|nr:efflux RND transporter permease subunit [Planctomycetota bacterium]
MNLVSSFVNNPVKVTVGVILLVLFGGIAYFQMPMQLVPEVQTPTISIETRWPGASPQEVEREIVQEQEDQLKGVEGVLKMSSESSDSLGKIILEFGAGTDMAAALLRVNTRLQQVPEYPEDADQPVLATSNSSDQAIAWFILRPRLPGAPEIDAFATKHPELKDALVPLRRATTTGQLLERLKTLAAKHPEAQELLPADIDMQKLLRYAENVVEARFERVLGVSSSNVYGGREDEMQVIVDPQRLAARGVTIQDVRRALATRNRDTSGGEFWEGKRRYVVRTLGQFKSEREILEVIVKEEGGTRVYVRDVAEVKLGFKKPSGVVRNMGTTVLALNVIRDRGANVLTTMEGLYEVRRQLNEGELKREGLQLDQVYDETEYIHSSVGLLRSNIFLAGILSFLVLLVFLRSARSTVVIGLAIPTSIIGTFLLLGVMGRSLNVISLAGLAFAVGMLVDNAVVVLENVFRHYQQGARRFEAAVNGTKEVWGAVVASTLTTLAVFLPILFVEEQAGQLFRDIALAISCSVGLSLIISVTLIPTFSARILSKREGKEREAKAKRHPLNVLLAPVDKVAQGFIAGVLATHRWLQRGVLRQLGLVVGLVAAAGFVAFSLWPKLEYLPEGNRNLVFGFVLPPPGYNLDEMMALGERFEETIAPYWEVEPGTPEAEKLGHTPVRHFFYVAFGRTIFLGLRAQDPLAAKKLAPLVMSVAGKLPGTFVFANQTSLFESGLTEGRTIDVEISGPQLEQLIGLGGRIMGMVKSPGVLPTSQPRPLPSLDLSNPEVHVVPRWSRAADLGVSADDLGYTVNSLVDGAYAGDYFLGGEKIDLTIKGQQRFAERLQQLEDLTVATDSGALVPLRALADVRLSSGPEQINRRERERAITIRVRPDEEMALEDAIDRIREKVVKPLEEQGAVGGEYRITLAGTADKLDATWDALFWNLILAVVITYLLMAALFESWLYPFVIILSVPLGAAGGVAGWALLNNYVYQPLDMLTLIGFVILIGTVVNNAILIVHQSLVHIREEDEEVNAAVLRSVRSRMRPIFMTVTTTVCSLLPMVLRPGAGSELYRGLGAVLVGGLIVSTIFTLFLVPTLFRITLSARSGLARLLRLS